MTLLIEITVEYAMEAISHAGTVLGVLAKDGVVLAAEKKVTGKLLDLSSAKEGGYGGSGEKIFLLNSCVFVFLNNSSVFLLYISDPIIFLNSIGMSLEA
jgi:hypothetical protein